MGLVVAGDRSDAEAIAAVHCDIRMEKGSCRPPIDREVRPDDVDGAVRPAARLGSSRAAPADGSDGRCHIARLIAGSRVISAWIRGPGT